MRKLRYFAVISSFLCCLQLCAPEVQASGAVVTVIPVGRGPTAIDIMAQGNKAYVSNELSNNVSVIDLSSNSVIKTIDVGDRPHSLEISPGGKQVYVSN